MVDIFKTFTIKDVDTAACPYCGEALEYEETVVEYCITYYVRCDGCEKYFFIEPSEYTIEEYDPEA